MRLEFCGLHLPKLKFKSPHPPININCFEPLHVTEIWNWISPTNHNSTSVILMQFS